jgi:diacylglycerol kinase
MIQIGLIQGTFFLAIMSIFTAFFESHGFYTELLGNRIQGFLGGGNANTLGAFFAMVIGYYLAKYDANKKIQLIEILVIILAFLTIPLTASRTALGAIAAILIIFSLRNLMTVKGIRLIIIASIVFIISFPLFNSAIERLKIVKEEQFEDISGTSNRIGKWIFYINDMVNNPVTFLRGSDHELIMIRNSRVSAHNLFVQMTFDVGLVFLISLLAFYYRFYRYRKYLYFNVLYILVPLLLYNMTGSGLGIFWYFFFYLGFGDKYLTEN